MLNYLSPGYLCSSVANAMAIILFTFNLWVFFIFLFCSVPCYYSYEGRNPQVEALISLRNGLNDPHGVLSNWDEDSVDPCSWSMITCSSDNLVTVIGAPSQGLSGVLSGTIANLTSLKQVLLQNNNFSGHIPKELGNLTNLQTLDLSSNKFYGHVPESLGLLNNLQYLRLNNNSLTGPIPVTLAKVPQLAFLDLSYNNLSGPVPKFPTRAFKYGVVGNPLICGRQAGQRCSGYLNPGPLAFSINSSNGKSNSKKVATAVGVSLSFVVLVLLAIGTVIWRRTKKKKLSILNINDMQEEDLVGLGNLRSFTFKELQHATDNFSSKNILGSGGFGNVYRGKLGDDTLVAVKRLKDVTGTAGESQFRTELELISLAVHRNLLRLIGYCAAPNERLLVYPYMSNGSVASRLRGRPTLDWNTRKRVAIGAARGLLYLHEQCDPKIIHRDVKAANVLLDDYYEAIVGDFGLAKLLDHADSHVTTAVRGTVGHIAPEYLSTGQSSEKTDVFGFGILLVELITGMKALEFGKTANQKGAMLEWVKKVMQEKKFEHLVDRELGKNYDSIDVGEMLQVALLCTQYLPAHRPKMSDVVRMLEGEGLAEKWAVSHEYIINPTTAGAGTTNSNGNQIRYLQHNNSNKNNNNNTNLLPANHDQNGENVYDNSAMFEMITMDEDYDTNAMELSGPR